MLRTLAISYLLLAGTASVALGPDVYRWVDEHGGVHYSAEWVPGSVLIKTTKARPPTPTAAADSVRRASDVQKPATTRTDTSDPNAQAMKQDLAKVREQQCKEARERYEKAITARRIYKTTESDKSKDTDRPDDRQYLSDEEADAYRVKARQEVQELCGK